MYAIYGTVSEERYRHENETACNLVRMEYVPKFSKRNKRWATLYRLHLSGCLIYSSQAALNTAIGLLADAYAFDGYSWTLYHDDGTETRHRLEQDHANALSDVKVAYRSWPTGDPSEYATGRTYYIILEQLLDTHESNTLHYGETLTWYGSGGSERKIVTLATGLPVVQVTSLYTPVKLIQRGQGVGLVAYPSYRLPVYPEYLNEPATILEYMEPHFSGKTYTHYGVKWKYEMPLPYAPAALPDPYLLTE